MSIKTEIKEDMALSKNLLKTINEQSGTMQFRNHAQMTFNIPLKFNPVKPPVKAFKRN